MSRIATQWRRLAILGAGQVIVRTQDENDVVSFRVFRLVSTETRLDTDRPR